MISNVGFSIHTLTPAELLLLNKYKRPPINEALKYTFYDMMLRNFFEVREKKILSNPSERAFFVKVSMLSPNEKDGIRPHEEILLKIFPENSDWMSLKEFVIKLSNYDNVKFRSTMPEYMYEKYILEALIGKKLCQAERKKFLWFFQKRRVELNGSGKQIQEKVIESRQFYKSDGDWMIHTYTIFKKEGHFFESDSFKRLNDVFDGYFWDGVKNRHLGIAYASRGKYPKPFSNKC